MIEKLDATHLLKSSNNRIAAYFRAQFAGTGLRHLWEAFTRQDATLGIKSFIENKVRPGLIPLLISFFED